MNEIDPFAIFRNVLFVAVAVYTLVTMAGTVTRVVVILSGHDPHKKLLRACVSYQLVTIRIRPLVGELLEIALWLAVLVGIWQLHALC
ncbi:MAG: hypothetical protein PVJ57_08505 [Phycisphaerae bacterium]|jgi:hypothetical protein